MEDDFSVAVDALIRKAPAAWIASACEAFRTFPPTASTEFVIQRLPTTNNADLSFLMTNVVHLASGKMSWEALSWTVQTSFANYQRWQDGQHVELLWAGPSPADRIPARRIDQALYDLIANAQHEILLVTFAASKVGRLANELIKAVGRGVAVKLIFEFEEASEGQLSYDALKAFPSELILAVSVYQWPVEKRERNQAGKPGKLHAKVAIIDNTALVSSANLTDDAFNRNLEVGVMVRNHDFLASTRLHITDLIANGTLQLVQA